MLNNRESLGYRTMAGVTVKGRFLCTRVNRIQTRLRGCGMITQVQREQRASTTRASGSRSADARSKPTSSRASLPGDRC